MPFIRPRWRCRFGLVKEHEDHVSNTTSCCMVCLHKHLHSRSLASCSCSLSLPSCSLCGAAARSKEVESGCWASYLHRQEGSPSLSTCTCWTPSLKSSTTAMAYSSAWALSRRWWYRHQAAHRLSAASPSHVESSSRWQRHKGNTRIWNFFYCWHKAAVAWSR
jgi:hypothetical protein